MLLHQKFIKKFYKFFFCSVYLTARLPTLHANDRMSTLFRSRAPLAVVNTDEMLLLSARDDPFWRVLERECGGGGMEDEMEDRVEEDCWVETACDLDFLGAKKNGVALTNCGQQAVDSKKNQVLFDAYCGLDSTECCEAGGGKKSQMLSDAELKKLLDAVNATSNGKTKLTMLSDENLGKILDAGDGVNNPNSSAKNVGQASDSIVKNVLANRGTSPTVARECRDEWRCVFSLFLWRFGAFWCFLEFDDVCVLLFFVEV
jgi:hypothetical protein